MVLILAIAIARIIDESETTIIGRAHCLAATHRFKDILCFQTINVEYRFDGRVSIVSLVRQYPLPEARLS